MKKLLSFIDFTLVSIYMLAFFGSYSVIDTTNSMNSIVDDKLCSVYDTG